MAGQGSLRHSSSMPHRVTVAAQALVVFHLIVGLILGSSHSFAQAPLIETTSHDDIIDIELRWQWKSPNPIHWDLEATAVDSANGKILSVRPDSQLTRLSGELTRSSDQTSVRLEPYQPMTAGAILFRLRCSENGILRLRSRNPENRSSDQNHDEVLEIAVKKLTTGAAFESPNKDSSSPTWTIQRLETDSVRIRVGEKHSICVPDQPIDLSVRINSIPGRASSTVLMKYGFYEVSRGQTIHSGQKPVTLDANGNSPTITIDDNVLHDEGVYEFRCEIETDQDKLWSRLRRREPVIASNRTTLVVMSSRVAPDLESESNWNTVNVIRPSETTWSVDQWLPKQATRLIPGVSGVSGDLATSKHANESISVLNPQHVFQASLPVMVSHLPHKVTLRYPNDLDGLLQVDVAAGENRSGCPVSFIIGPDDRALIEPDKSNEQSGNGRWKTHTFIYYPSGNDQIWLTNLSNNKPVRFESIRIDAGPKRLVQAKSDADKQRDVVLRLGDLDWVEALSGDIHLYDAITSCSPQTRAIYRTWIATERLADYASIHNINTILIPACNANRSWFDSGDLLVPAWNDGADINRLATFFQVLTKQRKHAMVSIDPAFFNPRSSNPTALLSRESSAIAHHLLAVCLPAPSFSGLVIDAATPQSEQPIASEQISDLIAAAQDQSSTKLKVFVQAPAHQPHSRVATGDQKSVPDTAQDAIAIQSFVHQIREGLSMQSMLAQRLSSVRQSTPEHIISAAIGQTDAPDSPVHLCSHLDLDAARIIDQMAPPCLFVDLPLTAAAIVPRLAQVLDAFALTPTNGPLNIEPIDQASQSVHVHLATNDQYTFASISSMAPWKSLVTFQSPTGARWEVISGEASLRNAPLSTINQTDTSTASPSPSQLSGIGQQLTLEPGSVSLLRCRGSAKNFGSWNAVASGGSATTDKIKEQVTSVVQRIGMLSTPPAYDGLANGGFEQTGGMGLIGWLHAQHPPQCVRVERGECFEGSQSVLLTTDAAVSTRTWLVSETVTPPQSGQLAVSMACRGELKRDGDVHHLRVSIEATQSGAPIRQSADVSVPCNGKWESRGIVLEALSIDVEKTESLRLTIDSLSGGRVWIDDVRLHDRFPTSKERVQIQSQAFLAVQGLQRGNLTPSARLLQNHWAQFLLAEPTTEIAASDKSAAEQESVPGVADRVRSWLPRPLRF
ncbi:hypothetical protein [Rubripirellula reticaptiva]|nr:hypothetical protein [Rubripirellula reticaptiva]